MATSQPYIPNYQSYRDDVGSSGNRPSSREDLENYFEKDLPTPHHLSGFYPSSPNHSPRASSDNFNLPRTSLGYGSDASGPRYLSPLAAAAATETQGLGSRNGSQVSMVGLGASTGLQRKSTWLRKEQGYRKKGHFLFITTCLSILALIALGIGLGVYFGIKNKGKGGGDVAASGNNTDNTSTAGAVQQDGNDPSQWVKDPSLKNSFYGIAYTMKDSLYPNCNQGLAATIEDMQLLSQLTNRIRLYGSDCNQTALVLEAIKQTKIDMKVFVAVFIVDGDDSAYTRQKAALKSAIETYGVANIEGVTVGNEFMLNYVGNHGAQDATGAVGLAASRILKQSITDTRQMLSDLGHPDLLVGSADAGAFFNDDLLGAIDFGLSNIHAWFAQVTAAAATQWTNQFFEDTNVTPAAALPNKPKMYIAETGWPTHSSTTEQENSGAGAGGEASIANMQVFLDDFVCDANKKGTPYFFFEFMDIPWKATEHPGVEGFWGLFDTDKRLKSGITIPDCAHD